MLISNEDALKKLNSPFNLINSLKKENNSKIKNAMSIFIKPSVSNPSVTATIENIEEVKEPIKEPEMKLVPFVNPFEKSEVLKPLEEPSSETLTAIVSEADAQIKLGLAHNTALDLLTRSVQMLNDKLDNVKAEKLPSVIAATSKVVESIRKERIERDKIGKDKEVHFHFYTPQQKKVSDYEVIDVR